MLMLLLIRFQLQLQMSWTHSLGPAGGVHTHTHHTYLRRQATTPARAPIVGALHNHRLPAVPPPDTPTYLGGGTLLEP
jgi:hypothetical protein